VSEIGVVGAGLSGLTTAVELSNAGHHVTLFDRVPVSGGVLGYKDPLARELTEKATTAGVTFSLGTTALRWRDGRLLVAGPAGISWHTAQRLIVCTGQRPRTLAEMHVAGPRLSGVLPVTAAVHLLEAGARLGRRIVVLGDGWWTRRLAALAAPASEIVTVTRDTATGDAATRNTAAPPPYATETWAGWGPQRLRGTDRVTGVFLTRDGVTQVVSCDALVTAEATIPYRNVDGALIAGSEDLRFVQPLATAAQTTADAREAAAGIVTDWGGQ
jgi:NADPH-dependent 2,4-dienoyl-CoA reductase/sulfur reductase-like enzyme